MHMNGEPISVVDYLEARFDHAAMTQKVIRRIGMDMNTFAELALDLDADHFEPGTESVPATYRLIPIMAGDCFHGVNLVLRDFPKTAAFEHFPSA